MRIFTAIDIPEALREEVRSLLATLQPLAGNLRWARPEGLHITLKFIGEADEWKVEEIKKTLAGLLQMKEFQISIRGSGFFPGLKRARVFWLGIDGGSELALLARQIDTALQPLRIPAETREFNPHLTLARIEVPAELGPLQSAIADLGRLDLGTFQAREYFLYRSQSAKGGSIYTKLSRYELSSSPTIGKS